MRIDLPAAPLPAAVLRATRRTRHRAGAFAMPEAAEEQEEAAPATLAAQGPTRTACLLATEEIAASGEPAAGPVERDKAAARQGRALLGALAGLQLAVLGKGGVEAHQTLADLARALPQAADPGLADVLRAIAQRAAIELARAG